MATATFDITIEGDEFRVTGLRLMKNRDRSGIVELPKIRDSLGRQMPCIEFSAEIRAAMI